MNFETTEPTGVLFHGAQLAEYVVQERLGAGRRAVVYRVEHTLGSTHALKVLTRGGRGMTAQLMALARVQDQLEHPGLLPFVDVVGDRGRTALVTDYVPGPSLAAWLVRYRPGLDERMRVFRLFLDGLHAAHLAGVVHGALTPRDVLIEPGRRPSPRIGDFGLAQVLGSPRSPYRAPERRIDVRADLYSVGVLLHELVTGAVPEARAGRSDLLVRDPRIAVTIRACMEPDAADRPRDVPEVVAMLDRRPRTWLN